MSKTIMMRKQGEQVTYSVEPASLLRTLRNGEYVITIAKKREPRTVDQNALMWMWFTCIEAETGTPKQDVHDYYCRKFLRKNIYWNGRTEVVVEGTSKQTKERMTVFLNQVQADAATEFGIQLPTPDDVYYDEFRNQYQ